MHCPAGIQKGEIRVAVNVILASASPRRSEILHMIGLNFTVHPSNIDESTCCSEPGRMTEIIAEKKAEAVGERYDALIIAADTVVSAAGKILGKPEDEAEAAHMLRTLSGEKHTVFTGVCLKYRGKTAVFHEATEVEFCPMSDGEISSYIATGEPMDKAGAYGIQGMGSRYIRGISGDFFNVMGFPVNSFYRHAMEMDGELSRELFKL